MKLTAGQIKLKMENGWRLVKFCATGKNNICFQDGNFENIIEVSRHDSKQIKIVYKPGRKTEQAIFEPFALVNPDSNKQIAIDGILPDKNKKLKEKLVIVYSNYYMGCGPVLLVYLLWKASKVFGEKNVSTYTVADYKKLATNDKTKDAYVVGFGTKYETEIEFDFQVPRIDRYYRAAKPVTGFVNRLSKIGISPETDKETESATLVAMVNPTDDNSVTGYFQAIVYKLKLESIIEKWKDFYLQECLEYMFNGKGDAPVLSIKTVSDFVKQDKGAVVSCEKNNIAIWKYILLKWLTYINTKDFVIYGNTLSGHLNTPLALYGRHYLTIEACKLNPGKHVAFYESDKCLSVYLNPTVKKLSHDELVSWTPKTEDLHELLSSMNKIVKTYELSVRRINIEARPLPW